MKYVLAAHALLPGPCPDPNSDDRECRDLAALEREFLDHRPRRAGRITRMACVGAAACLRQYTHGEIPGPRLGLFHGTAIGNLLETREILAQVVSEPDQLPSPIRFACSLSNVSAFFAAQVTRARGPNLLVSQGDFSFEGALISARASGELDEVDFALVGASDGRSGTRGEHLETLGYSADTCLGEGSGWLLLGRDSAQARGELVHVELLAQRVPWASTVEEKILEARRPDEALWVMPGLRVESAERDALVRRLPGARPREYLGSTGVYPTAAACGLAELFSRPRDAGLYAHVVKKESGRSALGLFRVFPWAA